jgi:hypothetical protein
MAVPNHVLIEFGSRWSSSLVLAEAELALHRWREDLTTLGPYGWGENRRKRFESTVDRLRERHDAWARDTQAGVPTESARDDRHEARRWLNRAVSILESAELDHRVISPSLETLPLPTEGAGPLVDALRAALAVCVEHRSLLDREAADDAFFAEGAARCAMVSAQLGDPSGTHNDRAELIDTLDGEVYLTIRGLNRAAQRAFMGDTARRGDRYVFQFLISIQRGEESKPSWRSDPPQHI